MGKQWAFQQVAVTVRDHTHGCLRTPRNFLASSNIHLATGG
jgi:hypothetical protein